MPRVIAAATCVLACTGCASGSPSGHESCESSGTAVAAAPLALIEADNRGDLADVLAGYTTDAIWLPPDGLVVRGRENFRLRYEALFRDNRLAMTAEVTEARADQSIGYAWGSIRGTRTPHGGMPPVPIDDTFFAVVRCEAGNWRVSHLMWAHKPAA